jgi:hypothetical protein
MTRPRIQRLALAAAVASLAVPQVRRLLLRGWVAATKSRMITVRAGR